MVHGTHRPIGRENFIARTPSGTRIGPLPPDPSEIVLASEYALVCRELADLKRQRREQTDRELMLVHELRSPVTGAKALVAALRYLELEKGAQVNDALARIEDRMDQLLALVDDILELSRAQTSILPEQVARVDLVSETRAVCQPYLEEADIKGISMTLDLPAESLTLRIAPQAYRLILSNLVSNAIKYTSAGWVRLSLRRERSWATLRVTDSGMGIPACDRPRLFAQFFRASNARQSQVPGTGLGLAAVKALVERCGARLQVDSEENQGSSFVVCMPLRSDRPAAQPEIQKARLEKHDSRPGRPVPARQSLPRLELRAKARWASGPRLYGTVASSRPGGGRVL